MATAAITDNAVEIAPGVHWVGALDPHLRSFDIILKTANGTSYNSYVVRGDNGVAIIDTVKENFADDFFRRLESVATYEEITTIVLNHLEPDHSGALPELLKRAPQAKVYLSSRAQMMLKALLKPSGEKPPEYIPVTTDDTVDLGGRTLRFLHTPYGRRLPLFIRVLLRPHHAALPRVCARCHSADRTARYPVDCAGSRSGTSPQAA